MPRVDLAPVGLGDLAPDQMIVAMPKKSATAMISGAETLEGLRVRVEEEQA